MRTFLSILIGLLLASPCFGDPAISGVSGTGTYTTGQTVTITGSDFGSKSSGTPLVWDNFEAGTLGGAVGGQNPVIGPAWTVDSSGSTPVYPMYSNTEVRTGSTKSSFHNFSTGDNWGCALIYPVAQSQYYFTFWYHFKHTSTYWSRNVKPWIIDGNVDTMMTYCGMGDPGISDGVLRSSIQDNGSLTGPVIWGSTNISNIEDEWIRIEALMVQSDTNATNGKYKVWIHSSDGIHLDLNNDSACTRTTSNYWNSLAIAPYASREDGTFTHTVASQIYVDDIYIDSSCSRVEIGNANTWASCTHREIQIPIAWATGEITVRVNRGSFGATDTAYLYVVDADGAVSDGYEITFGEESSTPAPPTISNVTISNGRVQ